MQYIVYSYIAMKSIFTQLMSSTTYTVHSGVLTKLPSSESPSKRFNTHAPSTQHNILGFTMYIVTFDLKVDGLFVHPELFAFNTFWG
jgi:hypothetical protein